MTPELIHDVEFREAKRGYSTQEVDDFLEKLASEWETLVLQSRDLRQRLDAAEARASELEARAADAERRAGESTDIDETLKRTLVLAQRTADAAIKEAEEQASRTVAAAQEQANRMLAEAQEASAQARIHAEAEVRRAHEDAQARVAEELRSLESARDQLRADVEALDAYLDAQRDRVRASQRELLRLLEDPTILRPATPPPLAEVTVPEPVPPAPVLEEPAEPEPEVAADAAAALELDLTDESADDLAPPVFADTPAPEAEPEAVRRPPSPQPDRRFTTGPMTVPVDVPRGREADDAYLAELRKAMTDDAPLGPREDEPRASMTRARFGRRG